MPILNGKFVPNEEISPTKHKLVGTFRSPSPPDTKYVDEKTGETRYAGVIVCPCGQHLKYRESAAEHWRLGHFDMLQYADL